MRIEHIHIKPKVVQKIERKHDVTEEEIREVFFYSDEKPQIRRSRQGRYVAFGRTVAGRYLALIFAPDKDGGASIISARRMDDREKRLYRRRR